MGTLPGVSHRVQRKQRHYCSRGRRSFSGFWSSSYRTPHLGLVTVGRLSRCQRARHGTGARSPRVGAYTCGALPQLLRSPNPPLSSNAELLTSGTWFQVCLRQPISVSQLDLQPRGLQAWSASLLVGATAAPPTPLTFCPAISVSQLTCRIEDYRPGAQVF